MKELEELGRSVLAQQGFSVYVGTELVALEPGHAEFGVTLAPHHLQQNGFAHGGLISYLVDTALTFAGGSVLGPAVLTQEYKVSYLRPAVGSRLTARAEVTYQSARLAVVRCDVYSGDGDSEKLCATSLGTVIITSS